MSDANKAIIRRLFDECLNSHDLALYPKLYTNVIYHVARVLYRGTQRNCRSYVISFNDILSYRAYRPSASGWLLWSARASGMSSTRSDCRMRHLPFE